VEYLLVEMQQHLLVGEHLDQEFELVLLLEVLEGALLEVLAGGHLAPEVAQHLHEELVGLAHLLDDARVHRRQLPVPPLHRLDLLPRPAQLLLLPPLPPRLGVGDCPELALQGWDALDRLVALEDALVGIGDFCGEGALALLLLAEGGLAVLGGPVVAPEQLLDPFMQRLDLLVLSANLVPEVEDGPVLLIDGLEQFALVGFQEVDLIEEGGEDAFVFVVLDLLLELDNALLVVLERLLNCAHVVLVGVDELRLLALQHRAHLLLQPIRKTVHRPHRLLDLTQTDLGAPTSTLYLLELTSGMFITISLRSAILL
jgi:hypothetical protein